MSAIDYNADLCLVSA